MRSSWNFCTTKKCESPAQKPRVMILRWKVREEGIHAKVVVERHNASGQLSLKDH